MRKRKMVVFLILTLFLGLNSISFAVPYTVKAGDSFWKISRNFGVSLEQIMKANTANEKTIIYPGQIIEVPTIGEKDSDCKVHRVARGDSLWKISQKYGVSIDNIISINKGLSRSTILQIGQTIKIPIINNDSSIKEEKYGEYLHWFNEVNTLVPIGSVFKVVDFYTGKSFMAKRTVGSYHADVETLTFQDTVKMKEIWGGYHSWERRPSIIEFNGRRIACSVAGMPHAGIDSVKGGVYTGWRSNNYGSGINFDYVKGNGMDGHFDIHFYSSKRHKDGKVDEAHQKCVKIAAGLIK